VLANVPTAVVENEISLPLTAKPVPAVIVPAPENW
jgi:hypothetical protein